MFDEALDRLRAEHFRLIQELPTDEVLGKQEGIQFAIDLITGIQTKHHDVSGKTMLAFLNIVEMELKRHYNSCPDCDTESKCDSERICFGAPLSRAGVIALKAYVEARTPTDRLRKVVEVLKQAGEM